MSRAALLLVLVSFSACNRRDVRGHLERAQDAVLAHKPNEALQWYHAALESLERDEGLQAQVFRARALRGAGDVYYLELKDYRHAVQTYRELIQLCPEAPETLRARLHLADLLRHEFRDLRGAIAAINDALSRSPPQSAELLYQVAALYFELGDYRQSELESSKVIQKYENSTFVDDAMMLKAQAVSMMEGRRADALTYYQELVDRFPDSELTPHALFEMGKLSSDGGNLEKAIETWVESLKKHPDPKVVQNAIAVARKQLLTSTPLAIGNATKAFDRDIAPAPARKKPPPKSSIEAVGGTEAEMAAEAKMSPEAAERKQESRTPTKPPESSGNE